jgi:hypothetical protein
MILQPARDYNRRFDRHNPYLPKSVGKNEEQKASQKMTLTGKRKGRTPRFSLAPKTLEP